MTDRKEEYYYKRCLELTKVLLKIKKMTQPIITTKPYTTLNMINKMISDLSLESGYDPNDVPLDSLFFLSTQPKEEPLNSAHTPT